MPKDKGNGEGDDGSGRRRTGRKELRNFKCLSAGASGRDIELGGSSGYIGFTLSLGTGLQYSTAQ